MPENQIVWEIWQQVAKLRNTGMNGAKPITYDEWVQICDVHNLSFEDLERITKLESHLLPLINDRLADEREQRKEAKKGK